MIYLCGAFKLWDSRNENMLSCIIINYSRIPGCIIVIHWKLYLLLLFTQFIQFKFNFLIYAIVGYRESTCDPKKMLCWVFSWNIRFKVSWEQKSVLIKLAFTKNLISCYTEFKNNSNFIRFLQTSSWNIKLCHSWSNKFQGN